MSNVMTGSFDPIFIMPLYLTAYEFNFYKFIQGEDFSFLCPHCGSEYMHHVKIDIFERDEDDKEGINICIKKDVHIDKCLTKNPSNRRNGLIIHFDCEGCHKKTALNFAQHKGKTLVEVRG